MMLIAGFYAVIAESAQPPVRLKQPPVVPFEELKIGCWYETLIHDNEMDLRRAKKARTAGSDYVKSKALPHRVLIIALLPEFKIAKVACVTRFGSEIGPAQYIQSLGWNPAEARRYIAIGNVPHQYPDMLRLTSRPWLVHGYLKLSRLLRIQYGVGDEANELRVLPGVYELPEDYGNPQPKYSQITSPDWVIQYIRELSFVWEATMYGPKGYSGLEDWKAQLAAITARFKPYAKLEEKATITPVATIPQKTAASVEAVALPGMSPLPPIRPLPPQLVQKPKRPDLQKEIQKELRKLQKRHSGIQRQLRRQIQRDKVMRRQQRQQKIAQSSDGKKKARDAQKLAQRLARKVALKVGGRNNKVLQKPEHKSHQEKAQSKALQAMRKAERRMVAETIFERIQESKQQRIMEKLLQKKDEEDDFFRILEEEAEAEDEGDMIDSWQLEIGEDGPEVDDDDDLGGSITKVPSLYDDELEDEQDGSLYRNQKNHS
jgi:hypothetical protein